MAYQNEFKLELKLNLKRIAMISIARTLWMSKDISNEIEHLIKLRESDLYRRRSFAKISYPSRPLLPGACACNEDMEYWDYDTLHFPCNYEIWEVFIDEVLEKTNSLPPLGSLKKDLEKTIVLIGEKVFHFFAVNCGRRNFGIQSFSPYGTDSYHSSQLIILQPWTDTNKDSETDFRIFLVQVCRFCVEHFVEDHQNEIIKILENLIPGLSFTGKKDTVFNILCVYHYTYENPVMEKMPLPKEYLNNADYIIPLEEVFRVLVCLNYSFSCKYFATKLISLDAFPVTSALTYYLLYDCQSLTRRFRCSDFNDCTTGEFLLLIIRRMAPEERLNFLQKHSTKLIVSFLAVWPFQELVSNILDACFENELDLDFKFLLQFIKYCIGVQNKSRHPVHKKIFFRTFKQIWDRAPENVKSSFLIESTEMLVHIRETWYGKVPTFGNRIDLFDDFNYWCLYKLTYFLFGQPEIPSLKLILSEDDLVKAKDNLKILIVEKCNKILLKKKSGFIEKFINELTIRRKEYVEFVEKNWLDAMDSEFPLVDLMYQIRCSRVVLKEWNIPTL